MHAHKVLWFVVSYVGDFKSFLIIQNMTTIKMIQISSKNELKYDMKISVFDLHNLHMTLNNNEIGEI